MTSNHSNDNPNAQRFIEIDGEQIPVTEEVYRAYKRPLWAEHKRKERAKRCRDKNGFRCTKDCKTCTKLHDGGDLSLDKFSDDGFDITDSVDIYELVADKLLFEQLVAALDDLELDERLLIDALFYNDRTERDYGYSEDYGTYSSTGYAGGQGENENRQVITVGGSIAGLERFETFLDCSNAKTTAELQSIGQQKLAELAPVKNVEASALPKAYTFGQDYFLGDLVTLYISRLGLEIATPVTSVSEIWERQSGHRTEIRFGEKLPNLFSATVKKGVIS